MKVLITGGAGFIGTHLSRKLLADGHQVIVVDNEYNGSRDNVPSGASYVHADVLKPDEVEPVFKDGIDAVCHLAGQVSIIRAFSNPVADLRTNVEGTLNIVQLCVKYKVPRLLYASSMTAYGDTSNVPTPESEPCKPDSYYGITKHAAERYVHSTAERPDIGFQFDVTSLRMFSVFGPGQALDNPYQGVLGIFSGKILRGEPLMIFGDGEQTRDFVYIGDIVEAWALALTSKEAAGKIINLGSGRSLSINQLASHVTTAFGYGPGQEAGEYQIDYAPNRPGEQRSVQADIQFAKAVLNWEPRTSFAEGLKQTIIKAREVYARETEALAKGDVS